MKTKVFFILLALFQIVQHSSAQVRIGGITPPSQGSLLDINADDNVSFGGLSLPRVTLNSLDNLDDIAPELAERPDPKTHIGLIIYALPKDKVCPIFPDGVYVWVGTQWTGLTAEPMTDLQEVINKKENNLIYDTDQNGNTIVGKSFGSAGVWMVHNLAVTKYADTTPINVESYTYPNSTSWGQKPKTYIPQQGLLYNWDAVTKGSTQDNDQKQSTNLGATPGPNEVEQVEVKIQGICPNGWHVPTDREWTTLTKELYLNPTKYSNYESNQIPSLNWNSTWDTLEAEMGSISNDTPSSYGAGNIAKDMCKVSRADTSLPPQEGFSKSLKEGGFNALLTGYMFKNTSSFHSVDYGLKTFIWSSSANSNDAYIRILSPNMSGISRAHQSKTDLYSVRCKKD